MTVRAKTPVNSAGLHAPLLAQKLAGMPADKVPTAYYAKGNYFTLSGRSGSVLSGAVSFTASLRSALSSGR